MAEKNIQIKSANEEGGWDEIFPVTKAENVYMEGQSIDQLMTRANQSTHILEVTTRATMTNVLGKLYSIELSSIPLPSTISVDTVIDEDIEVPESFNRFIMSINLQCKHKQSYDPMFTMEYIVKGTDGSSPINTYNGLVSELNGYVFNINNSPTIGQMTGICITKMTFSRSEDIPVDLELDYIINDILIVTNN